MWHKWLQTMITRKVLDRESPTVAVLYCYIKKKKNQAESRSVIDRERGRVNYKGSHE